MSSTVRSICTSSILAYECVHSNLRPCSHQDDVKTFQMKCYIDFTCTHAHGGAGKCFKTHFTKSVFVLFCSVSSPWARGERHAGMETEGGSQPRAHYMPECHHDRSGCIQISLESAFYSNNVYRKKLIRNGAHFLSRAKKRYKNILKMFPNRLRVNAASDANFIMVNDLVHKLGKSYDMVWSKLTDYHVTDLS